MKKSIYILLTVIISLFIFCNNASAAETDLGIAVWIECDYEVFKTDKKHIEKGRPLAFLGGYTSEDNNKGAYRLLNATMFRDHSPALNTWLDNDNEKFTYCWFKNEKDIGKKCNSKAEKYTEEEARKMIRQGKCPVILRGDDVFARDEVIFAGVTEPKKVYYLSRQYRFARSTQNNDIHGFGFDINGYLTYYLNGEFISTYREAVDAPQAFMTNPQIIVGQHPSFIEKYKGEFTKVAEIDEISTGWYNGGAEVIFDNVKNIDKLYDSIDKWYANNSSILEQRTKSINEIVSENQSLINSCSALNQKLDSNKKYYFENDNDAKKILDSLYNVLPQIKKHYQDYSKTKLSFDMCSTTAGRTTNSPLSSAYNCTMVDLLGNLNYVPGGLEVYIMSDIQKYLTEEKGVNMDESASEVINGEGKEELLSTLFKCSSYMYTNSDNFNIDAELSRKIKNEYENLAKIAGIKFVYDCESLLGTNLVNKINSYLNIIKLIIPILLVTYGIIDFVKAIFGDEESMKKAQKQFIKRIFIAILIFITPFIVNLILKIANEVWSYISPGTCGLF